MANRGTPTTTYEFLGEELSERNASAYVHIGNRFDENLRYLTRYHGSDNPYAFVYTDGTATLLTSHLSRHQAEREFSGDDIITMDPRSDGGIVGDVAGLIGPPSALGTVLVPESTAISYYRALAEAGFDVESSDPVTANRRRKAPDELECIRSVQRCTHLAMAIAEETLAQSISTGGRQSSSNDGLTTESLRREIDGKLASLGVDPSDNTVIGAGETCADLHFRGDRSIRQGDAVLIDLSPRGPNGYYGDFTRTFVLGEANDWVASAYPIVCAVQDTAVSMLEPGLCAQDVHTRVVTEFAEQGYESGTVEVGFYHSAGHGIGLRLHESPHLRDETPLTPGDVVTIEPGVYHPDRGGVRIEDIAFITEDGYELISGYPRQLDPRPDAVSEVASNG